MVVKLFVLNANTLHGGWQIARILSVEPLARTTLDPAHSRQEVRAKTPVKSSYFAVNKSELDLCMQQLLWNRV